MQQQSKLFNFSRREIGKAGSRVKRGTIRLLFLCLGKNKWA